MNDGGGDGAGCFDIKEWADTTELTNVEVAGLGSAVIWSEKERCSSKMKPRLLRGQFCILASYRQDQPKGQLCRYCFYSQADFWVH